LIEEGRQEKGADRNARHEALPYWMPPQEPQLLAPSDRQAIDNDRNNEDIRRMNDDRRGKCKESARTNHTRHCGTTIARSDQ